jgi:hypothetical protein
MSTPGRIFEQELRAERGPAVLAGRMTEVSSPQARRGQGPRRGKGKPLPRGDSFYTPGASDTRSRMERSSAKPLVWLHQQPAWFPPVVLAVLLIVGLAVPGWLGAAALVLVAAFLGWLAALTWPRLAPGGRLLRVAAVAVVLVVAIIQATR